MSIVQTVIDLDTAPQGSTKRRRVYYRCEDHLGQWHNYGAVFVFDPAFDADAHKTVVAAKVAASLAEAEFRAMVDP